MSVSKSRFRLTPSILTLVVCAQSIGCQRVLAALNLPPVRLPTSEHAHALPVDRVLMVPADLSKRRWEDLSQA